MPIVLATFPIVAGVPDSIRLLNIVFVLVVVFTLVQGPSLRPLAHRLGLIPSEATREIQVEAAPLDVLEAELLTMTVQPPSRLHNVTVLELRLPDPSVITLIIRDGHTFVPLPRHPHRGGRRAADRHHHRRRARRPSAGCARSVAAASSRTGSTSTAKPNRQPESAKPNRWPSDSAHSGTRDYR